VDLRPGYKQTEVGIIPEDWGVRAIEEVFALKHGTAFSSKHFSSTGPIVLTPGNFSLEGGLYFEDRNTKRYSGSYSPEMMFHRGDLLIVMTDLTPSCNLLGKPAFVETDEVILHNQRIGKVLIRNKSVHLPFLYYLLLSRPYLDHIREQAFGSTVRHTSNKSVYSAQLAWPPTHEQCAIAAALSDVDALLEGLTRLIAKKRDLKGAVMQQILTGQSRLPGFYKEWEESTVGREFDVVLGKMLDAEKNSGIAKPYIGNQAVQWGRIDTAELQTVRLSSADIERYRLEKGDLLVCEGGEVGRAAIWNAPLDECYYQKALHRLRPRRGMNSHFMAATLEIWANQGALENYVTQTSIAHLPREKFIEVPLRVPPVAEQSAVAAVLSDMDAELDALEARRDKTRAVKQAMMQELLTGGTRLVVTSSQPVAKPHNWQINEAVVVAVLVKKFASEQYPLGRKRCTKLAYLMHRHVEHVADGYLKKAAGPYNPDVKYKGPEGIAQKNGYIRQQSSGKFSGFVAAEKISEAERYFDQWYGRDVLDWLEQFRFQSNDQLELLATVDMAAEDLLHANARVDVEAIKSVMRAHSEWQKKLERAVFSDLNIAEALRRLRELFPLVNPP
jgi:type I restriction enzyme S subunit